MLQTLALAYRQERFLARCQRRHGNLVTVASGGRPTVIVFETELARQVLSAPPDQLQGGPVNRVLVPLFGARSVLVLDGEEHQFLRSVMLRGFRGPVLDAWRPAALDLTDEAIDAWPVGSSFRLHPALSILAVRLIVGFLFAATAPERRDAIARSLTELLDSALRGGGAPDAGLGTLATMPAFAAARAALDAALFDEISERRGATSEADSDMVSVLVAARMPDGSPLGDRDLRDCLVTLLAAGQGTTAAALAWTMELVLTHPGVLNALQREATAPGRLLRATVRESLRVRPIIPSVGRVVADSPYACGGYTIPPGIVISPSLAFIHRQAEHFPHPERFDPERFVAGGQADPRGWMPFGGGLHRCLGAAFALFAMEVVVGRVVARTELERVGRRPEKARREGVTHVPANGVQVRQRRAPLPS